uniref:Uncharacterized protein n=1 Tax=viral metagenome TaxID=1070528 RepID=A0A6M3X6R9_9ZZZZ
MSKPRLPYKDWEKLDELLGKHGFGGYYDLIECLKDIAGQLGFSNTRIDIASPDEKVDLPQMVSYLRDWASMLSNTPGFHDLADMAAMKLLEASA